MNCSKKIILLLGLCLPLSCGLPAIPQEETIRLLKAVVSKSFENELSAQNGGKEEGSIECLACQAFIEGLRIILGGKFGGGCLAAVIDYVCHTFDIEDNTVCLGVSTEFRPAIMYIIDQLLLNPNEICGLGFKNCGSPFDPLKGNWTVPVPGNKPPLEPYTQPKANSPTLKVLHLSDIHYDKLYAPGAETKCDEPLCCRAHNGFDAKDPAKYWGMQADCDLPSWTLESIFQYIKDNIDYDYLIWTGDLPPHNIWNQTSEDQIWNLRKLTKWFNQYFADKPIYPAVGNHESAPEDSFPPHTIPKKYLASWLYNELAEDWLNWLPQSTKASIQWRASYSVKPFPGLRLISLNTQYGDHFNFWLYLNQTDPDGTMTWLINELKEAEAAGEKVHIMGHIPPGIPYALAHWTRNYYSAVNRFENTIRAQFFGHTHTDQFSVFYEGQKAGNRPTGMAYVTPSVTTFSHHKPSFRVYTIDGNYPGSSFQVLDAETYILDLDQLNRNNKTVFNVEYSYKKAYGMNSLFPKDFNNLIEKMRKDESLLQLYNKVNVLANCHGPDYRFFYHRGYDVECDCNCRYTRLCEMRSSKALASEDFCSDLSPCPNLSNKRRKRSVAEKKQISEEYQGKIDHIVRKFVQGKPNFEMNGEFNPNQFSWYDNIIKACLHHE